MNPIEDKLRRLLALGESSNEHEAQRALSKAAELAARHNIDISTLSGALDAERVTEKVFDGCAEAHREVHSAARQIALHLFGVKAIYSRRLVQIGARWKYADTSTYIGFEHNAAAATFAHGFIIEQCGRDLKAARKSAAARRRPYRDRQVRDFCTGWSYAVINKYAKDAKADPQLEDSKTAIVLADQKKKAEQYIAEKHGHVPTNKSRKQKTDSAALLSGYRAGQNVTLAQPVENKPEPLRLANTDH